MLSRADFVTLCRVFPNLPCINPNPCDATLSHKIRKISQTKICKPASDAPKCRFARLIRTYSGRITRVFAATSAISASSSTIISYNIIICQYFLSIFLQKNTQVNKIFTNFRHFTVNFFDFLCVSRNFPFFFTKTKYYFLTLNRLLQPNL